MLGPLRQAFWLLSHRGQKVRYDLQRMRRLDWEHNRHLVPGKSKILILRDNNWGGQYNDHFLAWVRNQYPDVARRIQLERVPAFDMDCGDVVLLVPWLQDPLKELFPKQYKYAKYIQERCLARGAEVINPIDTLSVSVKSRALSLIANEGIRAAKVSAITRADPTKVLDTMNYPFFIRDDWEHGCPVHFVRNQNELLDSPWSKWENPIAVEFIDTRSTDGLYRKYRYYLFGDMGHNRHVIIANDWYVHAAARQNEERFHDEERQFCEQPNPHHDILNRLRKKLGFDIVAFDYAVDKEGRPIVWEPNPFPIYQNQQSLYGSSPEFTQPLYTKLLTYLLQRAGFAGEIPLA